MGYYVERLWNPGDGTLLPGRDRKPGKYQAFVPDELEVELPRFSAETESIATSALHVLIRADALLALSGPLLNYLLIRSEGISSSWIEGNRVSPKKLAIAEALRSGSKVALDVLATVRATESAIDKLANPEFQVKVEDIIDLQHTIEPRLTRGIRTEQNFVGGTGWSPLRAEFVPPPETEVSRLLENLAIFINTPSGNPVVRAALAHAQFETIHPFDDGNGRTGRALIHTILKRNEVLRSTLIPISSVFASIANSYVAGLTAFRRDELGIEEWIVAFSEATIIAAESVLILAKDIAQLEIQTRNDFTEHRKALGYSPAKPRNGSLVQKILDDLARIPVVTVDSVSKEYSVTHQAAHLSLTELAGSGCLAISKDHKGRTQCYTADKFLKLIEQVETRGRS